MKLIYFKFISGLRKEFSQELDFKPLTVGLNEVVDLLKNLPEAQKLNLESRIQRNQSQSCSNLFSNRSFKAHTLDKHKRLLSEKESNINGQRTSSLPKCNLSHLIHSPHLHQEKELTHDSVNPCFKQCEGGDLKDKDGEKTLKTPIASISKDVSFTAVDSGFSLPTIGMTKQLTKL